MCKSSLWKSEDDGKSRYRKHCVIYNVKKKIFISETEIKFQKRKLYFWTEKAPQKTITHIFI